MASFSFVLVGLSLYYEEDVEPKAVKFCLKINVLGVLTWKLNLCLGLQRMDDQSIIGYH